MRIPEDTICKICKGVFCCAQCRYKHEVKNHAIVAHKPIMLTTNATATTTTTNTSTISTTSVGNQNGHSGSGNGVVRQDSFETIYLFCPICAQQPLPLQPEIYNEMLVHVETHHLPLRCEKCSKMYYSIDDLKEFSKCMRPSQLCVSQESMSTNQSCYTDDASKVTVTRALSSVVHKSPMRRQDFNDSHMTPISIINMRWKANSTKAFLGELISDSVSSIKNISSINNSSIRRSAGVTSAVKGKVIRSTSTPVHLEMVFAKPKEQTFNVTGCGHMSSIQYTSGCESETSPALPQPSSQALESINRYRKLGAARPKISAVTPLRQVMSKSIQKAFAEHGIQSATTAIRGGSVAFQRKKMFDTTASPSLDGSVGGGAEKYLSPGSPALDLRLSPAVRRSQKESDESLQLPVISEQHKHYNDDMPKIQRNIILSAQKLTTESIVITHTEHLSTESSSSGSSSNGSINSVKPNTSISSSSYQTATSNSTCGSVFKSCSSVKIITATTEQIQEVQSVSSLSTMASHPLPPITPITRIPGAHLHKKMINFETPQAESSDSRESHNSPADIFFTPNSSPTYSNSFDPDSNENSTELRNRKLLVKQNLSGRFSKLQKPSIKECAHSTAFSRIENLTIDTLGVHADDVDGYDDDDDDDVFVAKENEKPIGKPEETKKPSDAHSTGGLWSIMSSVMGIPSRMSSVAKSTSKNESSILVDTNSNSVIKRCASIAGSLVRSKPLMGENELKTLKRKRTFTVDEQSTSAYLNQLNNSEATSAYLDCLATSSKRFRIQGRRPIDRMRLDT